MQLHPPAAQPSRRRATLPPPRSPPVQVAPQPQRQHDQAQAPRASVRCRALAPRPQSPALSASTDDLFSAAVDCPYDGVAGIIAQEGRPPVLTATPKQTLQAIIPLLARVTGLPVVDGTGRVVGVISRKVGPRRPAGAAQPRPAAASAREPALGSVPEGGPWAACTHPERVVHLPPASAC